MSVFRSDGESRWAIFLLLKNVEIKTDPLSTMIPPIVAPTIRPTFVVLLVLVVSFDCVEVTTGETAEVVDGAVVVNSEVT